MILENGEIRTARFRRIHVSPTTFVWDGGVPEASPTSLMSDWAPRSDVYNMHCSRRIISDSELAVVRLSRSVGSKQSVRCPRLNAALCVGGWRNLLLWRGE